MKKYDALYIFVGIAKEDAVNERLEKALAEVTRLGGNVLETVVIGAPKDGFARPMKKHNTGIYVKVRIELDPAKVSELVNRYHLVEEVFRVQILAVDERREQILAGQAEAAEARAALKAQREAAEAESAEPAPEAVQ